MFNPGRLILEFLGAIVRDVRNVLDQHSDSAKPQGAEPILTNPSFPDVPVGAELVQRRHEIPPDVRVVTLSDLIMELGEEVKRAFPEMTERERQLLDVILQVERYCEMRSLETWEAMAVELYDDDVAEGTLGDLLEEIVQLGRGQLYCEFSRQHAYDDYQAVRVAWRALGVEAPADAVAERWQDPRQDNEKLT